MAFAVILASLALRAQGTNFHADFQTVLAATTTQAGKPVDSPTLSSTDVGDMGGGGTEGSTATPEGPPKVRATEGKAAFDNTKWQVFMRPRYHNYDPTPSAIFTVTLKDDETAVFTNNEKVDNTLLKEDWTAVFTDNENVGSWKADG